MPLELTRIPEPPSIDERKRDGDLIERMASGDSGALGALFDLHADAALGLAHRILGNRQDAEDLVHDVFLEVWSKASDYDPKRAGVRAWLMVRTRSRAIDRLRALDVARRHAMAEAAKLDMPDARPRDFGDRVDAKRARAALGTLSPEQRSVVELAYFMGLTLREIAEEGSIPLGTVKSRLAAALTTLRKVLDADSAPVIAAAGDPR